jgi:predicted pyridoxine 5'-phosphate oxidase superfamily flavin-nucleotide-binding protein
MSMKDYFGTTKGTGVIATADREGKPNLAVYSRPYVIDDSKVVFIVADRLTRKNLKSNPAAAYMFIEAGGGFAGKRLSLTMTGEGTGKDEADTNLIEWYEENKAAYPKETLFLCYFRVDEVLPLVNELEPA